MPSASRLALFFIVLVLAFIRIGYFRWDTPTVTTTLSWDAFGYYLYLPGKFIYHDLTHLEWLPHIVEQYQPTGHLYQVMPLPNGNFAMKYLMGLSILYLPFFFLGHWAAGWLGHAQDGFSAPYQLAICFGAWVYAVIGLLILRRVLLRFFSEPISALTLLLVALASNYPQYVSADSGMTHGFLFTVYSFALYVVMRWHERPSKIWAFLIGLTLGVASITRPTEGVMLFIPLLWRWQATEKTPTKWAFFRQNPAHLALAAAGVFLGILPQLMYWKAVTGQWIFDVGSKFLFFQPHWQVLFGWEKGWFIYTPVTILMVAGMFLLRGYPFRRAVWVFALLNIWIIIAWSDWRYGATYSCRALVQSYPVLTLPLAVLLEKTWRDRRKYLWLPVAAVLVAVNLFQIWQYNRTIIHYDHMNRRYYQVVFLNPDPTPLDMSLLDTDEMVRDESLFAVAAVLEADSVRRVNVADRPRAFFLEQTLAGLPGYDPGREQWLKISAEVASDRGAYETELVTELQLAEKVKRTACRMQNGRIQREQCKNWNLIQYYFRLPPAYAGGQLAVFAETRERQDIFIQNLSVQLLTKQ